MMFYSKGLFTGTCSTAYGLWKESPVSEDTESSTAPPTVTCPRTLLLSVVLKSRRTVRVKRRYAGLKPALVFFPLKEALHYSSLKERMAASLA